MASSSPKKNCRKFTLREIRYPIKDAIKEDKTLGKGSFSKVYKGYIQQDKRKVTVAVKWLKQTSDERGSGFDEEIAALTEIKHPNIVSLIGYCDDKGQEILVYEYVANSTLDYHLHERPSKEKTHLKWNERLGILIGSARGLHHLHHGICTNSYIHRDIKSANILLQDNLVAKIGDFGMAKCVALDDHDSLDNERVGTFGYMDPYYFNNGVVTRASDTYSFGIMIFEVLSGRQVVDDSRPQEEGDFAYWAKRKEADEILDPLLLENFSEGRREALHICCDVARRCLHSEPKERPGMSQVLAQLELAQLTSQRDPMRPLLDDNLRLSPFELENTAIDVGSRGSVVYTAVIPTSRKKVAVKSYRCEGSEREFLAQVMKLSSLNHNNVVKLYHYWMADCSDFYVYEFALKKSMHHCLRDLTLVQRYQVAVDIAKGLHYIHKEKDLIHCNVKSSNVLIFEDGKAKLSDLLTPKPCGCNGNFPFPIHGRRSSCKLFHTPEFPREGDTKAGDLYKFGVVLLELLTGKELADPISTSGPNFVSWARKLLMIEERGIASIGSETPPQVSEERLQLIVEDREGEDFLVVKKIAEVALWCVENNHHYRPSTDKVLKYLDVSTILEAESSSPEHPGNNSREHEAVADEPVRKRLCR